jgi:SAM-dependent methyltransferase
VKLNLGCGQNPMDGWTNVDWIAGPGVDKVLNLEDAHWSEIGPLDSVDEIYASHLIEHINDPLGLFAQLWHVAKPGAIAAFACPYGSSDDADEDPTHVRRLFMGSWAYFAQPTYWRGNTEYMGDWQVRQVQLRVNTHIYMLAGENLNTLMDMIHYRRNIVTEMVAQLECIKPARSREHQHVPHDLVLELSEPGQPIQMLGSVRI